MTLNSHDSTIPTATIDCNGINDKSDMIPLVKIKTPSNNPSSSMLSAIWNTTNLIQGIGILGIPYAMLKGGWLGILMNVFAAFTCCSTGKMIIECLYVTNEHSKIKIKVCDDFPDIGEKVWPKFGRTFVTVVSVVEMFGASTLYIILMGSTTHTLFKNLLPNLNDHHWYLISCSFILAILFVKELSYISWFSLLSIIALFGTVFSVVIYCIIDHKALKPSNVPKISVQDLPISMGIIIFSYCAHPLLPAIEGSMKKPEHFSKMIIISYIISLTTKVVFGIIPLLLFGRGTLQIIIDNFRFEDYGIYLSTHIFVLITVFFSSPLVIYILSSKIDNILLVKHFHRVFWPQGRLHYLWILSTRVIILSSILLTGMVVPYFALVMSFIGSFTGTCLTFLFPCWFSMVLKKTELSLPDKCYRIILMVTGTFFGLNGMIFAAKEMIKISHK